MSRQFGSNFREYVRIAELSPDQYSRSRFIDKLDRQINHEQKAILEHEKLLRAIKYHSHFDAGFAVKWRKLR